MAHSNLAEELSRAPGRPPLMVLDDEPVVGEIHDHPPPPDPPVATPAEAAPETAAEPAKPLANRRLVKGLWWGIGVTVVTIMAGVAALETGVLPTSQTDRRVSALPVPTAGSNASQSPQSVAERQRQSNIQPRTVAGAAQDMPVRRSADPALREEPRSQEPQAAPAPVSPAVAPPAPAPAAAPPAVAGVDSRSLQNRLPPPSADQIQLSDLITLTNRNMQAWKAKIEGQEKRIEELTSTVEDLRRRVSLAEATAAVSAANPSTPATPLPQPIAALPVSTAKAPSPPVSDGCRVRPQLRISAVSPGYVTLEGSGRTYIDMQPKGDANDPARYHVDCYGDILQIVQQGPDWMVKFDRDVISSKP